MLRLEVELRDKNTRRPRNNKVFMVNRGGKGVAANHPAPISNLNNYFVPLEKVSNRRAVGSHTDETKNQQQQQN